MSRAIFKCIGARRWKTPIKVNKLTNCTQETKLPSPQTIPRAKSQEVIPEQPGMWILTWALKFKLRRYPYFKENEMVEAEEHPEIFEAPIRFLLCRLLPLRRVMR